MGRTLAYCTSAERDGYQRNTCCHESGDNTRVQNRLLPQHHLKSLGTCCRESCSIAIVLHMPRRSLEPKLKVSQDSRVKRMASQTESAAPLCSLTQQPCRDLVHQHDLEQAGVWFRNFAYETSYRHLHGRLRRHRHCRSHQIARGSHYSLKGE